MGASPESPARSLKPYHVVALLVAAALLTLGVTGFVWADSGVTLVVDGDARFITSDADTVDTLLADAGIVLGSADVVSPTPSTPVTNGMTVVVRHAVPVVVDISGEPLALDVVGSTVADALVAAGLDPASGCAVEPSLDTSLAAGMTISVSDVFVRVVEEYVEVDYTTVVENDPSMAQGSRAIKRHGEPGTAVRVFRMVVTDGVEGPRTLSAEQVVAEPVDEVVAVGTNRSTSRVVASRAGAGAEAPREGRTLTVVTTAYSPGDPGVSTRTATGARATYGVIAVDPSVIPLGTRVYIPGYGNAIAADTGGAIKGAKIDLCFDTRAEALAWGRRSVTITILP